jgi:hypothetical protein
MNAHAQTIAAINAHADEIVAKARKVDIVGTLHGAPGGPRYTVLVDGQYYTVNRALLNMLRAGETPAELELEPEPSPDEAEELERENEREAKAWDRHCRSYSAR